MSFEDSRTIKVLSFSYLSDSEKYAAAIMMANYTFSAWDCLDITEMPINRTAAEEAFYLV